ncbi:MAG: hypothetical protein P8Z73_12390 [Desulfobacteraceae bacterium]|jgi:hypothetical protein
MRLMRVTTLVLGACLIFLTCSPSHATGKWFASVYAGQYSNTALNEIIRLNTDFERSQVYVLSLGKELGIYKDVLGYEIEGQVAWHSGMQHHEEVNCAFTLRWLPFFWDKYLDTSFAFGNGLSFATADPELEIREGDENKTNALLWYILVETAFSLPQQPQWSLFVRIHHRSSVFGLIDNITTGSNFVGLGLRYKF